MTLPLRVRGVAALALVSLSAACASSGRRSGSSASSPVLTATQLATANSDNLYDAINKLRPEWLTSRGPTSATDMTLTGVDVYIDGNMMGKADYLREVRLLDVTEVRYYDAGQASARFGMGHQRGVIQITRK